jgi:hypothetical protein
MSSPDVERLIGARQRKKIHDLAVAAMHYARAAKLGADSYAYAFEIMQRAKNRACEFVEKKARKTGPGRGKKIPSTTASFSEYTEALETLNLSTQQMSKWRASAVPESTLEAYVKAAVAADERPTCGDGSGEAAVGTSPL